MTQMSGNADLERFVPHKCLRNIPVLKAENKTISKSFNAEYSNNVKNAILALSRLCSLLKTFRYSSLETKLER